MRDKTPLELAVDLLAWKGPVMARHRVREIAAALVALERQNAAMREKIEALMHIVGYNGQEIEQVLASLNPPTPSPTKEETNDNS